VEENPTKEDPHFKPADLLHYRNGVDTGGQNAGKNRGKTGESRRGTGKNTIEESPRKPPRNRRGPEGVSNGQAPIGLRHTVSQMPPPGAMLLLLFAGAC
jgi:hypothetical protein